MSASHPDPDGDSKRAIAEIFHLYDPPVWLVAAAHEERRGGLIATSAMRASIVGDMPRMLVGLARQHHTWALVEASGRFSLHLLAEDDLDAVWRFGLQSGHSTDKFADLAWVPSADGNPIYCDCRAWMDCRVEDRLSTGDRTFYLATAHSAEVLGSGPVLTVATLMREAPTAQRDALQRLYSADQAIDAAAIRAWRDARGLSW